VATNSCGTFFCSCTCGWPVGRRAQRVEDEQHLFLFDQLARLLDRLGRVVAVVELMKLILRPLMPPSSLTFFEVGADRLADGAVGRCRARIRADVADLDFLVGRAGVVLLLRQAVPLISREARPATPG
jgi:hypothetical protein